MIPASTASRVEIRVSSLPAARDPAGPRRGPPGERVEQLRLAVALGPGDPDDLTAVQREADRAERLPLQCIDDEHFLGFRRRRHPRREHRLERASDDAFDELRFGRRRGVEGSLVLAVAKHGDPVCDLEHFGQPMADVDHTDAAPLARQDGAVERLTSSGPSAVVGSSSSSTLGSLTSALATSNSWRSAIVSVATGASGNSSRSRSKSAST